MGIGKMGWGRWAARKIDMEGHGPGKVGVGKRGGEVATGKMGAEHMPHGSSGEDVAGHSCLPLGDAMQGTSRLSILLMGLRSLLMDSNKV